MIYRDFHIVLDIKGPREVHIGVLKENDIDANRLICTVLSDGEPVDLSGDFFYIQGVFKKPSGTLINRLFTPVTDGTDGKVMYAIQADLTDEIGLYKLEIMFYEGTSQLTSLPLTYTVKDALYDGSGVTDNPDYPVINIIIEDLAELDATKADITYVDIQDTYLQQQITDLTNVKADLTYVNQQDASLQAQITDLDNTKADQTYVEGMDTFLQNQIDQNTGDITNLQAGKADISVVDSLLNGLTTDVNEALNDLYDTKADLSYVQSMDDWLYNTMLAMTAGTAFPHRGICFYFPDTLSPGIKAFSVMPFNLRIYDHRIYIDTPPAGGFTTLTVTHEGLPKAPGVIIKDDHVNLYVAGALEMILHSKATHGSSAYLFITIVDPGVLTASTTATLTGSGTTVDPHELIVTLSHDGTLRTATVADVKSAIETTAGAQIVCEYPATKDGSAICPALERTEFDGRWSHQQGLYATGEWDINAGEYISVEVAQVASVEPGKDLALTIFAGARS